MKAVYKRGIALTILICALPGLGGCGRTLYNYREVEQLQVIKTMGIDRQGSGVLVSLASAAEGSPDGKPTQLSASGDCVSSALERMYELSYDQELFCYHIDNILIGEKAAEEGVEEYLRFICRSPFMRIKSPIFVLRDGKAEDAVKDSGSGDKGVSEIMQSLRQRLKRRGAGTLTDTAEVIGGLRRYGSALVCAVELTDSAESSGEEEKPGKTASVSGYGIIREGRLCRYIDAQDAVAADLLINELHVCDVQLKDRQGRTVMLELFGGDCTIVPVWEAPGSLKGLEISAHVSASVMEADDGARLGESEYIDQLTAELEEYMSQRIKAVLQSSGELRADFLGLAGSVEQASPRYFKMMSGDFPSVLPRLELQISVSGEIVHTNDLKEA